MSESLPWPLHPAAELFPLLGDENLIEMAEDIRAKGLLEPVWLYDDPERGTVLLDGRNRVLACQKAGVDVATRMYLGNDPIGFSIAQNMQRRHLTTGQKADVALRSLPLYEAEAERRKHLSPGRPKADEKPGADRPDVFNIGGTRSAPRARDKAAKSAGTSGRAVARMKRITEHAPDLAEKVRAGDMALDRAERIIRDREAEQRRIEEAKREAEAQPEPTIVDIRLGDFRDELADLSGVDAIITDPPYGAEYLPLLRNLAAFAHMTLAEDGVLAVLLGQTHLPDAYRELAGYRPYRWTACYLTAGPSYVSHARQVHSNWKPLLIYGAGPRLADVIRAEGGDAAAKDNHRWGQDYAAFHTIIERLTTRGQTVVDPFCGSGTTLLAAHALGRHAIGCDIDPESVQKAKERLYG